MPVLLPPPLPYVSRLYWLDIFLDRVCVPHSLPHFGSALSALMRLARWRAAKRNRARQRLKLASDDLARTSAATTCRARTLVRSIAKRNTTARLFMMAPGIGAISALLVA